MKSLILTKHVLPTAAALCYHIPAQYTKHNTVCIMYTCSLSTGRDRTGQYLHTVTGSLH